MRRRYQTEEDRAREAALMDTIRKHWRVGIHANPDFYELDCTMHLEGSTKQRLVTGFAELKHRLKDTWNQDVGGHGDYMIAMSKWRAGVAFSHLLKVPCVLVVRWQCGTTLWAPIAGRPMRVTFSGRFDRDDEQDQEPCVRVPLQEFQPLTTKPEGL